MMKKDDAKSKMFHIYLAWRRDIPDPPSNWIDKNASDFYGYIAEFRSDLLEFADSGDKYQTVKSWVLEWDRTSIG